MFWTKKSKPLHSELCPARMPLSTSTSEGHASPHRGGRPVRTAQRRDSRAPSSRRCRLSGGSRCSGRRSSSSIQCKSSTTSPLVTQRGALVEPRRTAARRHIKIPWWALIGRDLTLSPEFCGGLDGAQRNEHIDDVRNTSLESFRLPPNRSVLRGGGGPWFRPRGIATSPSFTELHPPGVIGGWPKSNE